MRTEFTHLALLDEIKPEACLVTEPPRHYRFGDFELCSRPLELTRDGERLELAPQPARLLELLVSRAGELVSREVIRQSLWGEDVHVDHERGINFNIRQIRSALGDDPSRPLFIETVPRYGYRFVAPLGEVGTPAGKKWLGVAGLALLCFLLGILALGISRDARNEATGEDELSKLSPAAADEYRIGLRLLESRDSIEREKAVEAFERVIEAEPEFAPAYAGLAHAGIFLGEEEKAQTAARMALTLDPDLANAHLAAAELSIYRTLEAEGPRRHIDHVLALDPSNEDALTMKYWLLQGEGRSEEALEVSRHLLELDPLSWQGRWNLSMALFIDRQYEEAAKQIRATVQLYPQRDETPYQLLIHSLVRLGRTEEAIEEANRYLAKFETGNDPLETLEGWWRLWLDIDPPAQDHLGSQRRPQKAILHLSLGEGDAALALLQEACEKRSAFGLRFLRYDPRYDPLRLDPGFQEVLKCMDEMPPGGAVTDGATEPSGGAFPQGKNGYPGSA